MKRLRGNEKRYEKTFCEQSVGRAGEFGIDHAA